MPNEENVRGAQLREYLNDAREAILWKCEGLSDAQARTPLTPTGTHVMGLLLHLAVTESQYFISCLGREIENPTIRGVIEAEDPQADFLPPPNMTLVDAVEIYRETTVAADAVLDELALDSPAVVPWWIKHRHTTCGTPSGAYDRRVSSSCRTLGHRARAVGRVHRLAPIRAEHSRPHARSVGRAASAGERASRRGRASTARSRGTSIHW